MIEDLEPMPWPQAARWLLLLSVAGCALVWGLGWLLLAVASRVLY
jgi:hypothetical protein